MQDAQIDDILKILQKELAFDILPVVSHLAAEKHDPFVILISTLLSLRTKDEVTAEATNRLFQLAASPQEMLQIPAEKIAETIYPVGFYRVKARTIHHVCRELIGKFSAIVPDNLNDLLSIKGIGRKTANLVIALGYGKDAICVDIHVHRISNRLGYVNTNIPEETEFALRGKLPLRYWIMYNTVMVAFGRKTCKPVSPLCSRCPVYKYCDRVGITISR